MVGEGDGAVLALQLFSAGAADDGEGVAAAIEQDQRLLAAIESRLGLLDERAGKELLLACLLKFAAHVDQLDLGQRAVHHAVAHLDALILARRRVLPAFKRRRRRTHHHHRALYLGAHHGHVAGVVARRLLLLVALVVLLVHQNQAELGHRRKDGRARADDDRRIAPPDAPPLLTALLGVSAEWSSATFSQRPRPAGPTLCGVRPISGTSRIDDRPRSSARCIAAR